MSYKPAIPLGKLIEQIIERANLHQSLYNAKVVQQFKQMWSLEQQLYIKWVGVRKKALIVTSNSASFRHHLLMNKHQILKYIHKNVPANHTQVTEITQFVVY